ncbi:hypothetical protein FVE85_7529 [Porphyridium purpureum]|uniref:Bacterial surface antigen (D15) domain-containing protein n=1 Tax=Porphyridium purpureum TaxID=35688 RepID=A0A5J4ZAA7_PORPP|nr:hypothetical protein FVE85_7529 [Porphyridium purpureum]|eukprot:POR8331..scf295_1
MVRTVTAFAPVPPGGRPPQARRVGGGGEWGRRGIGAREVALAGAAGLCARTASAHAAASPEPEQSRRTTSWMGDFQDFLASRMKSAPVTGLVVYGKKCLPDSAVEYVAEAIRGQRLARQDVALVIGMLNEWYRVHEYPVSQVRLYEMPTRQDGTLYLVAVEPTLIGLEMRWLDDKTDKADTQEGRGAQAPTENETPSSSAQSTRHLKKRSSRRRTPRTRAEVVARIAGLKVGEPFQWPENAVMKLSACQLFEDWHFTIEHLSHAHVVLIVSVRESATFHVDPGITAAMNGEVSGTLSLINSNLMGTARRARVEWEKRVDSSRSGFLVELQDPRFGRLPAFGWSLSAYRENRGPEDESRTRNGIDPLASLNAIGRHAGESGAENPFNRDGCKCEVDRSFMDQKLNVQLQARIENINFPVAVEPPSEDGLEQRDTGGGDGDTRAWWAENPRGWLGAVGAQIRKHQRWTQSRLGSQCTLHANLVYDSRQAIPMDSDMYDPVTRPASSAVVNSESEVAGRSGERINQGPPADQQPQPNQGHPQADGMDAGPRYRPVGWRHSMSFIKAVSLFESFEQFWKLSLSQAQYLAVGPTSTLVLGGTLESTRAVTGHDVPGWELHRLGGARTVRGFEVGALGVLASSVRGTVELRRPLYGQVDGVLFLDAAAEINVDRPLQKPVYLGSSTGFGLRFANLFKVDWARTDSGEWKLHFGVADPSL